MQFALPSRFHVLRERNFRLFWVGQLVSLTGTWMQSVVAGLVVLELTDGSTLALAAVNVASSAPSLLLMLFGGVTADRYDRRKILIVTQSLMLVVALITGILIAVGLLTFWQMLLLNLCMGVVVAFSQPAEQALVPSLVAPRQIPEAIALNQTIFNGSRLLGPAVAALLFRFVEVEGAYFANAISYLAVIASLLMVRTPARPAATLARVSPVAAIREGLRFVWQRPLLRSLMGVSALASLFLFPGLAVISPAYVREALHEGKGTVALLFGASGAASMVGAIGMLWIPAARRGIVMLAAIVIGACALLLMAVLANVLVITIVFGMLSLGLSLTFGLNATTIQQATPDAVRGRVMAVSGLTFGGVMPVAVILTGAAVEVAGLRAVYAACGVLYLLLAVPLLLQSGIIGRAPSVGAEGAVEPHAATAA